MIYPPGATSQSVDVTVYDDSGLPVAGLVAATFPAVKYSRAGAYPDVAITLSDLALITSPHTPGGLKERGEGRYRLDLPDLIFNTASAVTLRGEQANKRLIAAEIQVGVQTAISGVVDANVVGMEDTFGLATQESVDDLPTASEIAEALAGVEVTLQSALAGGSLTIHHGAEYSEANGNRVPFRFTTLPDLTGGEAKLIVSVPKGAVLFEHPLPIEDAGEVTQTIWFELTGEKSLKVSPPAVYVGTIAYKAAGATAFAVARELSVNTRRM